MSRETIEHLNTNVLIGNTDQRGHAWHYRASAQGDEPNHYAGFIPVEDVRRRLFYWNAVSRRMAMEVPADVETMTHLNDEGEPMRWVVQDDLQGVARDDNHHRMGVFTEGYAKHQYEQWLLTEVANILDDDLGISSAGLLKDGAIAWVEVSVPESITTPEGVVFRPNLLATTSFDGSIATVFKRSFGDTVCDNTRAAVLAGAGEMFKVKHSRNSLLKLGDARDALAMIHTAGEEYMAEIAALCAMKVTDKVWGQFLTEWVPLVDGKGDLLEGRSKTSADKKRDGIAELYRNDVRVQPWAGTAHGVLQAVNTFEHHKGIVRGATRQDRNALRTITGDFATLDRDVFATLTKVMQVKVPVAA